MGALNWLFGKRFNTKLKTASETYLQNRIYQALYGFGLKYTQYDDQGKTYIEKGYNSNSDVYAVVSQKATEVQRIPYTVKSVKDTHQKETI